MVVVEGTVLSLARERMRTVMSGRFDVDITFTVEGVNPDGTIRIRMGDSYVDVDPGGEVTIELPIITNGETEHDVVRVEQDRRELEGGPQKLSRGVRALLPGGG